VGQAQRYRFKVDRAAFRAVNKQVGPGLLAAAKDFDCDLLVMGAYSHSLLRQLFLGGVTRHVGAYGDPANDAQVARYPHVIRRHVLPASQAARLRRQENTMYAAVRQGKAKAGMAEELAVRIKEGAIPIISDVQGFRAYCLCARRYGYRDQYLRQLRGSRRVEQTSVGIN
jgi:hypothetical protein